MNNQTNNMKTLLRHTPTGQYYQSMDKWTGDRDEAHDFGLIARAMKFARKARLPGLELILSFDSPEQAAAFHLGSSNSRCRA
jgi:hypothetical protein